MKHGILITAYKNFEYLLDIIDFFDDDFYFFIHIDKKFAPSDAVIALLKSRRVVKLVSTEYVVNWGGLNHLKAILLLADDALAYTELDYLHVITGQDFPIKSPGDFKNFFLANNGTDYLEHFKMPLASIPKESGGMDRIDYYNLYDVFDAKKSRFVKGLTLIQKLLRLRRSYPAGFPELYLGSTYWSLTRETVRYVLDFTLENPAFFSRFKYTFCSEEIYFQTVLMNSGLADKISNDNLRYIDWTPRSDVFPNILDMQDYDRILTSNKLFARKLESPLSDTLKQNLKIALHQEKPGTSVIPNLYSHD